MAIVFPIAYKVDSSALKSAQGEVGGFTAGIKGMIAPLAAVAAGFAAAFSVTKLVEGSIKSFEDLAGSIRPLQRLIGGTTEEVSGLRAAMQLSGMSVDKAGTSLTIFSKKIAAAGADAKKTAEFTAKLGTDFKDANGNILPMAELLPKVADQFKSMPDGVEKTALAVQLFGRQGTAMLPFLNKGSDGIAELTEKASKMGLVLDDASMKSFVEAKKASREFDATMQGLSVTVGSALLPIVEAFQNFVRNILTPAILKVTGFIHAHRQAFEDLANTVSSTLQPIVDALSSFLTGTLLPGLKSTAEWFRKNGETVGVLAAMVAGAVLAYGGFRAVTGIIAAVTLAQEGYAVASYGAEAASYASQGAAKIGAAIYAIQNSTIVTGIAAWVANTAAMVANTEGGVLAKAATIAGSVATGIATAAQYAWNAALAANPIGLVVVAIAALVAGLVFFFTQTKLGQQIWGNFVSFLTDTGKNLGNFFGTLWDGIGKAFNVVFKAIGDAFKGYVNIWIGLINFIIGALDSVKIDIPKWVPVVGGQTFGINIPKIPQLADGGIVPATPGGRLVNVGEGGQAEAIIPLSRMNTGGNTASYNIVVNAGMGANGVQIAKELINTIKQYERANGAVWKSA